MTAVYKLVADSALAKTRPDISIDGDELVIGRTATGAGALPIEWAPVSGKHCKIVLASKVRRASLTYIPHCQMKAHC